MLDQAETKADAQVKEYWGGGEIIVFQLEGNEDHRQKQQALGPTEPAVAVSHGLQLV